MPHLRHILEVNGELYGMPHLRDILEMNGELYGIYGIYSRWVGNSRIYHIYWTYSIWVVNFRICLIYWICSSWVGNSRICHICWVYSSRLGGNLYIDYINCIVSWFYSYVHVYYLYRWFTGELLSFRWLDECGQICLCHYHYDDISYRMFCYTSCMYTYLLT